MLGGGMLGMALAAKPCIGAANAAAALAEVHPAPIWARKAAGMEAAAFTPVHMQG